MGERLSALVDGELGPDEHETALIHLAKCESCRFEADMLRRLKRRLHGLCEPEPDHDFMGRLAGLSRDPGVGGGPFGGPPGPPPGSFGSSAPLGSSRPLGGFPGEVPAVDPAPDAGGRTSAPGRSSRRRTDRFPHLFPGFPGGRYAVAGIAVATALLGSAFVAGGSTEEAPVVEPRLADFALEHAVTSRHFTVAGTGADEVGGADEAGPAPAER
nr:zf-HC2 domain-containing protein [Nocardiopsis algeriensis]